jgi:KDO2-lipid IV(A) lauroyltransferase
MRLRLIRSLFRLLSWLPLPTVHAFAAALGALTYRFFPNTRSVQVLNTNIRLCHPHLNAHEQATLAHTSLQESAKAFAELGALWLWPCQKVLALVREVENESCVQQAFGQNKGVILLTPHLGGWEMTGLYVSANYPLTGLYRPPKQHILEDFVKQSRERCGATLVPTTTQGIRALLAALKRREAIGILPDQDPSQRGQGGFAPFFGVPAYTMRLVAGLARKTGAPVIFTYAERLPRGQGFRLRFLPAPPGIADADDTTALTALNQGVEQCARGALAQYQWAYKRFKTRPPGADALY